MSLNNENNCPICMKKYKVGREITNPINCSHCLCIRCWTKVWMSGNHRCPFCRLNISQWLSENVNNFRSQRTNNYIHDLDEGEDSGNDSSNDNSNEPLQLLSGVYYEDNLSEVDIEDYVDDSEVRIQSLNDMISNFNLRISETNQEIIEKYQLLESLKRDVSKAELRLIVLNFTHSNQLNSNDEIRLVNAINSRQIGFTDLFDDSQEVTYSEFTIPLSFGDKQELRMKLIMGWV